MDGCDDSKRLRFCVSIRIGDYTAHLRSGIFGSRDWSVMVPRVRKGVLVIVSLGWGSLVNSYMEEKTLGYQVTITLLAMFRKRLG